MGLCKQWPFGLWVMLICSSLLEWPAKAQSYRLLVWNDGPAILDSNVTFRAFLEGGDPSETYSYFFSDSAFYQVELQGGPNISLSFQFSSDETGDSKSKPYAPGKYFMKVVAKKMLFKFLSEELAKNTTQFKLTNSINGNLIISGPSQDIVAVNNTMNVTSTLWDPSGFFKHADIDYSWTVNEKRFYGQGDTFSYNISREGTVSVDVVVHARVPVPNSNISVYNKWGFFKKEIQAMRAISNVTVTGSIYLKQGDLLALDVSCEGSGPFSYCKRIFPPDQPLPLSPNMTCGPVDPVIYSQCSFHIQRYFPEANKYTVGVIIQNRLGSVAHIINIVIYDVSKKAQLSTVLVPIACSLLAFLIMVVGMAYHLHQRKTYVIEVADFDFQQTLPLDQITFLERVKESFKAACDRHASSGSPLDLLPLDNDSKVDGMSTRGGGGSSKCLLPSQPSYGAIA